MTASQLNKFKNIKMNITEKRKNPLGRTRKGERVRGVTQE